MKLYWPPRQDYFSQFFPVTFAVSLGLITIFLMSSCAYQWGPRAKSLPGGYKQVSVPMFRNKTHEVGIETSFTNSMIQEFYRSKVARIIEDKDADVRLVGEVETLKYEPAGAQTPSPENYLPEGAVWAASYNAIVQVHLRLVKKVDGTELWRGSFRGERSYAAPQVTLPGINSVNPLYNLSARRQVIDALSIDLMAEAFDRLTENF